MSMVLALDSNVFVAATYYHGASFRVLQDIKTYASEYLFALDPYLEIWNAYMNVRNTLKADYDAAQLMKALFEINESYFITIPEGILDDAENEIVKNVGCGVPVEPALIAVASSKSKLVTMIVVGEDLTQPEFRNRGTHQEAVVKKLRALSSHFQDLDVWTVATFVAKVPMLNRSRFPSTEEELALFISDENEMYEFKQPGEEKDGIQCAKTTLGSDSIMEEAMQAVCGMLNANGGEVFIGIMGDRTIMGIDLPGNCSNSDDLQRYCRRWFSKVRPKIEEDVSLSVIPSSDRWVIRLHIRKGTHGNDNGYWYVSNDHFIKYQRCGSETVKIKKIKKKDAPEWLREV